MPPLSFLQVRDPSARVEHEASTSKIGEDQLFYFQQRGIEAEEAVGMIISGFCSEVRAGPSGLQCPELCLLSVASSHTAWHVWHAWPIRMGQSVRHMSRYVDQQLSPGCALLWRRCSRSCPWSSQPR